MTTANGSVPPVARPEAIGGAEDVGSVDRLALLGTAVQVAAQVPTVARAGTKLAGELAKVVVGRSAVEAEPRDWRFKDPTWTKNPGYHRLMQGYLATCSALGELAEETDLSDWRSRERARFLVSVLTSSLAPTNTLLGNPAALKQTFETGGSNLVAGAKNFVSDWRHNGGLPSQVDRSQFVLGKDVAVTPGAVVFRNEVLEVLQYTPQTPNVHQIPVVVVPPQINKFYFMDLSPGRSLTEFALQKGIQFFAISWRNPGPEHRDWNLDTYGQAIIQALDAVEEITKSRHVHLFGLCAGGITTSTVLNHLTDLGDDRVRSVCFGVTLLDWNVKMQAGMMMSPQLLKLAAWRSRSSGIMDGQSTAAVFTWMRPNDLVWNYWVNDYLMGKKPAPFDILAWNADKTNLPAALHNQFLQMFQTNMLAKPGGTDGARFAGGPEPGQGRRLHHRRHHRPPHSVAWLLCLLATAGRAHHLRAGQHRPHPDADLPARKPEVEVLGGRRAGSGPRCRGRVPPRSAAEPGGDTGRTGSSSGPRARRRRRPSSAAGPTRCWATRPEPTFSSRPDHEC